MTKLEQIIINAHPESHLTDTRAISDALFGVLECAEIADRVEIIWSGLDPLEMSIDFYQHIAIRALGSVLRTAHMTQVFQTSGQLLDQTWCEFFRSTASTVELVVYGGDPREWLGRAHRVGGILRENGVNLTACVYITEAWLRTPDLLHELCALLGARCLKLEFDSGLPELHSAEVTGSNLESHFDQFIRVLWNLSRRSTLVRIEPLTTVLERVMRPIGEEAINSEVQAGASITLDTKGNFFTFARDIGEANSSRWTYFNIAHGVQRYSRSLLASRRANELALDVDAGVQICRGSCEYFAVCGGGSPVQKFLEHGTVVTSETLFCRLFRKHLADFALEIIEESATRTLIANRIH